MICIKNGMIYDAVTRQPYCGDIYAADGKITAIVKAGEAAHDGEDAEVFDASGKYVYPGFVEAHCHIGLDGYGIGFEGQDYNEMNDILSPQLRGIDSLNPMDETFDLARKAGITCTATGPGSANVLGGTFVAVKTAGKRVDDMIVKNPVAMKCAFGENPKRCYKDKNNYARMSTAAKLREMLFKAQEYMERKEAAGGDITKCPAFDMKLESLIPVLRGEIPLKAHAHRADDIFTAIRIAKEFHLKLTLEHCTEGHLIVDELVEEGYPVIVGPSLSERSKIELRNLTFETPGILSNEGLQVSLTTDHPVIPVQYLPVCAGIAVKHGMKKEKALEAITINPAKILGIDEKVGSIEIGKDADIVIWDNDPFELQSNVLVTIIDGKVVYEK